MIRANALSVTVEPRTDWLEYGAHSILAAMLFFVPFAFGGTQAWSQEIFFILVTALVGFAVLVAVKHPSMRFLWSWTYLPILLFVLLVLTQLVSWPVRLVAFLSPHTTALRSTFLFDQPNVAALLSHQTFTLYPLATVENLRLVFAVAGVFFAVSQFYRTRRQIEILLGLIAAAGFAVSLLAVHQNITSATTIYGIIPAGHRFCGPFMNYSQFSQFMNLSIGATLGLALLRWTAAIQDTQPRLESLEDVREFLAYPRMRIVMLLTAAIVIEAITLLLSMGRMGAISMISAGAITGVLLTWRTRSGNKGSVVVILGIVVLAAALCVGFDAIYDRLATVRQVETVQGGRWEMLRDMGVMFKRFPVIGTGLGTHEFVFPMVDHSTILARATHSENEFAQLLEEAGFTGLLLSISFLSLVGVHYWKCIRKPQRPIQYAAFGLGFGLIAILIHSFSDFGQHMPANALLTACAAGLLINISRLVPKRGGGAIAPFANVGSLSTDFQIRRRRMARLALAVIFLSAGGWCIAGSNAQRAADEQWDVAIKNAVDLRNQQWNGSDEDYIALLTPATAAANLQPQNVKYRYWLNTFRWHSLARLPGPDGKSLLLRTAALPFVSQIVNDLIAAQPLCPTYAPNFNLAGELDHFVLHQPLGIQMIAAGVRLNPKDPGAVFIAGELALDRKDWDEALADFRSAVNSGADKREAIQLFVEKANQPAFAYQLAGSDSFALNYLMGLLANRSEDKKLAERCRADLVALLETQAGNPNASAETLASLAAQYASKRDKPKAIAFYRRAVALDYSQVDWHYQLATLLGDTGDPTAGMGEARVCLRLRPQMKEAETLLGNLSLQAPAHPDGK